MQYLPVTIIDVCQPYLLMVTQEKRHNQGIVRNGKYTCHKIGCL